MVFLQPEVDKPDHARLPACLYVLYRVCPGGASSW